jgi:phosphate starvation-inducible PhoH-like protein
MKKRTEASQDLSPYTEKKKKNVTFELKIKELPWTEKQKKFIRLALEKETKIILVKGVAGTSKTLLSVYCSLLKMRDKKISEIYYSRVPVESSVHGIGYIKGDVGEKMHPYIQPMQDKLDELLGANDVRVLMEQQRIHGIPLGYLRGLNISNSSFIMDEAQNCRIEDFLLVMTRMAKFSTLFICGDVQQSDIKKSGFDRVFEIFDTDEAKKMGIHTFEFGKEDILRSEILSYIIEKFETINFTK